MQSDSLPAELLGKPTMEYYSAIKRNTFESVLMRWMNLEPIIEGEVSQKEKEISYTNVYIQNLERWYRRIYLQGSNGETERINLWAWEEGRTG